VIMRNQHLGTDIIVEVADSGSGIPKDLFDDIFTPFVTTKKEGTGLGLPIAKKIIDAHGGAIHVIDNSDKGVTFRITVPVKPQGHL
ncbi:MAG: ATP-binding protein, partial [Desulfobulbaceae bacterium]|nr:ATP-binding protein [Desulfobulbaceae bacterium]